MDTLNQLMAGMWGQLGEGVLEGVLGVIVAAVVLRLELTRRTNGNNEGCVAVCKAFLRQWAPETFGVIACLAVTVAFRKWGESAALQQPGLQEIAKEWPILLCADTLLSFQLMLRLLVLLSLALRAQGSTPVSQEAAALFLVAGLSRVALFLRTDAYKLDGPLGGDIPKIAEIAALPFLFKLTLGIQSRAVYSTGMTIAIAAWLASRHQLNFAEDTLSNGLFSFVHVVEIISAFTFFFRTFFIDTGFGSSKARVPLGFAHILMPIQQSLAGYYFVQAFIEHSSLIGAGRPFELLQIGAMAQFGAYAGAAVLYFAEYLEG